ncbi:translation initiation factor IF-2 [Ahniella affigens]|uniref:Translation initiation factor IF-2 n=1 Tax=Ahniella affigens TaxID=2021234 RepID=A0A2P1PRZ6_9GAMM|nr:translation initiation factor IF-2 [Ahniella affigens]AVP97623.1 translation initiation factor IF-2 [Ahniella affigens]
MSDVTVRQLAQVLGMPVDKLVEQFSEAGMKVSGPDQVVSSTEKVKLLGFLRRTHGKKEASPTPEASPKQITLKRKQVSEITVSAGAARGKTVNIEVRQKRTYVKRNEIDEQEQPVSEEREHALRLLAESKAKQEVELKRLRDMDDKQRAVEDAKRREEDAKRAAIEAERRAEEAAKEAQRLAEVEAARLAAEEEARSKKPADGKAAKVEEKKAHPPKVERPPEKAPPKKDGAEPPHRHKGNRGSHRMQLDEASEEDFGGASRFLAGELHLSGDHARRTKKRPRGKEMPRHVPAGTFSRPTAPVTREIAIGESITVADLANKLALKGSEVVKALFKMGVMATINQTIDHETAVLVVEELGHKASKATGKDAESVLAAVQAGNTADQESRPPIVTIMGHVDHGKTSLLDYIRRTKVAAGEAGGITQHIGAYHVKTPKGVITFLDTPGHAAFTAMRARGARLTDIVVLVVAADDGVMPQTLEAIQHAKAANVPLIVAINKMDKPDALPERVKQGLIQHEVVPEEYGGETQCVPVSAKTGMGVDDLLDGILLQAEVMELKAASEGRASGIVVESSLDKGRGPVATVLVQRGTLRKGDFLVCGVQYGRMRAMFNEVGQQIAEAGPSIPVVVLGLSGVPEAGDDFIVVADERLAKEVAAQREQKKRETRLVKTGATKLEDMFSQMAAGEMRVLNLVVKADVQGSVEALRDALVNLSNDSIRINVIASGVGGITESDATLAAASKAVVIGFNVRADGTARKIITENGLDLRYFSIIYDVIDQVKQVASGLLGKEIREEIIGVAQVRDVFRSSKFGQIAGCMVIEGNVKRNKPIRVLRDNVVIFEGELESLRRFKEAVEDVRNGMECGIGVKQYNDVRAGDQIECFERIEVARSL